MLLRMLSRRLCGCEEKKRLMCTSPMVLWWIMTCLCLSKETWNSKKARKSYRKSKNDGEYQLLNLKKNIEHWNSGQHIPDMLSGCWTNSWYCHVIGRTQNTVKHNEQWHVSNWNTMNFNCLPRNRQPLPYIYIYTHSIVYICNVANIWGLILDNQWEACKEWRNKGIVRI